MATSHFKELTDALKDMRTEDSKFLDKYTEQIETLKAALVVVDAQKKSWINRHKWFVITIAIVLVIFVAPIVMQKNNICQLNIKLNENVGLQRCK